RKRLAGPRGGHCRKPPVHQARRCHGDPDLFRQGDGGGALTAREEWHVEELRLAPAVPFGPRGHQSAIDKQPVAGPVRLTLTGFEGDQQGDTKAHGGPDKAVHVYGSDHYPAWREELP